MVENNECDVWSGLSYFLAEMIEKYAEELEEELKYAKGISNNVINIRKMYEKYVVAKKFRRKKIINIDYCYLVY